MEQNLSSIILASTPAIRVGLQELVALRPGAISRTVSAVSMETPQAPLQPGIDDQPGMAERAIDTATDVSRTIGEVTGALSAAVDRLGAVLADARRPGKPLAIISAITREAPLSSLAVAFLLGVAITRRR
jgi:hypothetical protein